MIGPAFARVTSHPRWRLLHWRLDALRAGDALSEVFLTVHTLGWAVILLMPGTTTGTSKTWHYINQSLDGDVPLALLCAALGVMLLLATLRLVDQHWVRTGFLIDCAYSVGLAVLFVAANPIGLGAFESSLRAGLAFRVYMRLDRE